MHILHESCKLTRIVEVHRAAIVGDAELPYLEASVNAGRGRGIQTEHI